MLRLDALSYRTGKLEYRSHHATEPEWALPNYITEAQQVIAAATVELRTTNVIDPVTTTDFEELRWFPLPSEVVAEIRGDDSDTVRSWADPPSP